MSLEQKVKEIYKTFFLSFPFFFFSLFPSFCFLFLFFLKLTLFLFPLNFCRRLQNFCRVAPLPCYLYSAALVIGDSSAGQPTAPFFNQFKIWRKCNYYSLYRLWVSGLKMSSLKLQIQALHYTVYSYVSVILVVTYSLCHSSFGQAASVSQACSETQVAISLNVP